MMSCRFGSVSASGKEDEDLAPSVSKASPHSRGSDRISGGLFGKSEGNFRIVVKMPPSYLGIFYSDNF